MKNNPIYHRKAGEGTMIFRFNVMKTIQAAAVLLKAESPHRLSRLRLLKLLYIADRSLLQQRARSITGDRPVAMDHGPVLTGTYELLKGEAYFSPQWEQYIQNEGRDAVLKSEPGVGELSRYEIAKLHEVAARFRDCNDWEVAEFTHTFPEWVKNQPKKGTCKAIPIEDILSATGILELRDKLALDTEAEAAAARLFGAA